MANENKNNENKVNFNVDGAPPFTGLITTAYTDSVEFCNVINGLMHNLFCDFYGSKIEVGQNRQICTALFFVENQNDSSGRVHAIERIMSKDTLSDMNTRLRIINSLNINGKHQNAYQLTSDGKEILERVVSLSIRNSKGKFDWEKVSDEKCFNNNYNFTGQNQVYYRVMIDINRLIKTIYGKDKDGGNYQYMVNLGGPINPVTTFTGEVITNKWQLFILRLSEKAVEDIAKKYGYGNMTNNLGIIC
jgi:hypothetical protein